MRITPEARRLYDLENSFMDASLLGRCSLKVLQHIADKACRRWRVPLVKVRFCKHAFWYGEYDPDSTNVRLFSAKKRTRPGSGHNVPVVLHEVAHHIVCHLWDTTDHGAKFAAVTMDLYDHYGVLPSDAYKLLAKRFKVKIARLRKRKPA